MNTFIQEDQSRIVSFDHESLILVDENDQEIGLQDKLTCHQGAGVLHRAFSLFIFNQDGELLIQQRGADKHLWPLYWSNSCCSHPRYGEKIEEATHRRLMQELGMKSDLNFIYKFQYQAYYLNIGAEHELCWVFVGKSSDLVQANHNEIANWRFIKPNELEEEMNKMPEEFTPWFKMEWASLTQKHSSILDGLGISFSK